jgi:hypothetical protein
VLATDANPELGEGANQLARAKTPRAAMKLLIADPPADWIAVAVWARAAEATKLVIAGPLTTRASDLFAMPFTADVVASANRVIVIPDAHRSLVEVAGDSA